MPIYSDAARAFADKNYPRNGHPLHDAAAFGFDAGQAAAQDAALATVTPTPTPRTITTYGELDALPGGSAVRGFDGWVYQSSHDSLAWYLGLRSEPMTSNEVAQDAPLTLLVPATAAPEPEPVRLTDPDDPRIKPGARVRGEWDDGSAVEGIIARPGGPLWVKDGCLWSFGEFDAFFLLAEAPDPDADVIAVMEYADQFRDHAEKWAPAILEGLRAAGYDVVKRADS